MIEYGNIVSWSYQVGGKTITKKGKIFTSVAPNVSATFEFKKLHIDCSNVKFNDISPNARYIIEVKEGAITSYLAPTVAIVDKCNKSLTEICKLKFEQLKITEQLEKANLEFDANVAKEYKERCTEVFATIKDLIVDNSLKFKDVIDYLTLQSILTGPPLGVTSKESKMYTYKGESHTLNDWAIKFNMSYHNLYQRVAVLGWSIDDALNTPLKTIKKKLG